jgi:hypothetical protein
MKTNVSEFPKHPLPYAPQPEQPQRPHVQPPTILVYEKPGWEYKVLSRIIADEPPPTEDDLNALGNDGWELVGILTISNRVQFYLKRSRT